VKDCHPKLGNGALITEGKRGKRKGGPVPVKKKQKKEDTGRGKKETGWDERPHTGAPQGERDQKKKNGREGCRRT